nr:hypothetical protein [Enterobacter roggenkampii]
MTVADPNLYDYWPYRDRPKIVWPGGKKLAFWVAPNIEFYEFDPARNPGRAGWPKPAPDVVAYSQRDWGNRVGHWRLMELLDKYGPARLGVAERRPLRPPSRDSSRP